MLKETFKIDRALYPPQIIEDTLSIFSDFLISYDAELSEIIVESDDPQLLFDEFANYLLAQINEH